MFARIPDDGAFRAHPEEAPQDRSRDGPAQSFERRDATVIDVIREAVIAERDDVDEVVSRLSEVDDVAGRDANVRLSGQPFQAAGSMPGAEKSVTGEGVALRHQLHDPESGQFGVHLEERGAFPEARLQVDRQRDVTVFHQLLGKEQRQIITAADGVAEIIVEQDLFHGLLRAPLFLAGNQRRRMNKPQGNGIRRA